MQATSQLTSLLLGPLAALFLMSAPLQARAQAGIPPAVDGEAVVGSEALAPLEFHDPRLKEMVADLQRSAPTAAAMLLAIRQAGYPVAFGTFHDLADEMRQEYRAWNLEQRSAAGFMAPVVRRGPGFYDLQTTRILIAVNLATLDGLFENAGNEIADPPIPWEEIRRLEKLSVLAHELVHAYGLAMAGGDPRLGCADPREGERPEDSCVMNGENLLRREMGAPLSWDYGFPSLASLAERYSTAEARRLELLEIGAFRLTLQPTRAGLPRR